MVTRRSTGRRRSARPRYVRGRAPGETFALPTSVETPSIFPKLKEVGEVIAERTLILEQRGRRRKKIILRLGKPQMFPEGDPDYFCPYQILGFGEDEVRCVAGVDAFQAIHLVLIGIAIELHFLYRREFGEAFYFLKKGDNLGFAEPTQDGRETYQLKPRRRSRKP
jgi:hypothetical protein